MVFGFGFNKQRVLATAEKNVQQGKLQNAITEYEKIIKADPRDLTVVNTVGDLYARIGEAERAIECFKQVGDAYASEGFTVKAIAVYKKITKLQPTLEGTLKLAELYTQQGLFNDARSQYLQVAEDFLKTGELEQAIRIFQKTLEMDPENVAMKLRLADVYVRLGKKPEAFQIYNEAAATLRHNGSLDAAEEVLGKMQKLDPSNSGTLLLRGRNALESGDSNAAIALLEKVPDLDQHADALRDLMNAYFRAGRTAEAGVLANKLSAVHNDSDAISEYVSALMNSGNHPEALKVYEQHADRLISSNTNKAIEDLHTIIGHVRGDRDALEKLLVLLQKAGDPTHVSEIMELLAHASVQANDLEKARDLYLQLATMEPQNALHSRNYQQVIAKLGNTKGEHPITSEEGALLVDELEAIAPFIDQHYPEKVSSNVRAALTDAELFVSYNMPEKALGPLMAVLPSAPRHVRLNQRLAALHTRTGRFAEAAICSRTLQSVYAEAGFHDEASRYGELASKYEERAALVAEAAAADAGTTAWPVESGTDDAAAAETAENQGVQEMPVVAHADEIDISGEWEDAVAAPQEEADTSYDLPVAPASESEVQETIAEIQFYLQYGMAKQAKAALAKLEGMSNDQDVVDAFRAQVNNTPAEAVPQPEEVVAAAPPAEEIVEEIDLPEEFAEEPVEVPSAMETAPASEPEPEPVPQAVDAPEPPQHEVTLEEFVHDLEAALPDDFMEPASEPVAFPLPPVPPPAPPAFQAPLATASVGGSAAAAQPARKAEPVPVKPVVAAATPATVTEQPQAPAAPPAAVAAKPSEVAAAGADLNDIFDELKADLQEHATPLQEDPEDHYNLGIAFCEMGLIDEAIGELQKVCQAIDKGAPFAQTMQAYTWLAHCFLEKGVPEAAIRWYEKALRLPTIDEEARTALHYELAAAYEAADNKRAALAHYMEVYGANIDYRDVGERIHALRP